MGRGSRITFLLCSCYTICARLCVLFPGHGGTKLTENEQGEKRNARTGNVNDDQPMEVRKY